MNQIMYSALCTLNRIQPDVVIEIHAIGGTTTAKYYLKVCPTREIFTFIFCRRECRQRGLPKSQLDPISEISVRKGGWKRRPLHFRRFRKRRGQTQPDTRGSFWKLAFPEPIDGPLALGFGCHYGLGLFARRNED